MIKYDVCGVLLLDKPIATTSNGALQVLKRLFKAKKAGHTGSLDPIATGMLPICFGEATKFAGFLLDTDKIYKVTAKLGIKTSTCDTEGEIISTRDIPNISKKEIDKILDDFRGEIEQIPPMYSAIKYKGQPLYKLARQGISIEREKRPVTIYSIELTNQTSDELEFVVHSSKGTYIRTLIDDIGEKIGCGMHVFALRRLAVGKYKEDQLVTLETLEKAASQSDNLSLKQFLLPIESMFSELPKVEISESSIFYLRQGQPVIVPHSPSHGFVKIYTKNGIFAGIGEITEDGKVAPKRLIGVR